MPEHRIMRDFTETKYGRLSEVDHEPEKNQKSHVRNSFLLSKTENSKKKASFSVNVTISLIEVISVTSISVIYNSISNFVSKFHFKRPNCDAYIL